MQTQAGSLRLLQRAFVTFEPAVRFSRRRLSRAVEAHHEMAAFTLRNEQLCPFYSECDPEKLPGSRPHFVGLEVNISRP